ncbi:glycoside hydrolase family 24 protein [Pseudoduganella aquatica]|uniref:glycoside hydrolase family 24 protein n=1 Tax=Pseudoduganella aquatica TaxID=2660641 RepID=UPI001E437BF4|nr:glycoside hydrolase family 104 protein [Pseudoduganella aquatica]
MDRQLANIALVAMVTLMLHKWLSDQADEGEQDQTGSFLDRLPSLADIFNMTQDAIDGMDMQQARHNIEAFLDMLRYAEGTLSDEGYRALFGWRPGNGRTFDSFADHPRLLFPYTNLAGETIQTSAAGAYQITRTTYDALVKKYPELRGRGFDPQTQDDMAVLLIAERGALADVQAGRLAVAIDKLRKVWASLPNSNVNQPTRSYAALAQTFTENGGVIA